MRRDSVNERPILRGSQRSTSLDRCRLSPCPAGGRPLSAQSDEGTPDLVRSKLATANWGRLVARPSCTTGIGRVGEWQKLGAENNARWCDLVLGGLTGATRLFVKMHGRVLCGFHHCSRMRSR